VEHVRFGGTILLSMIAKATLPAIVAVLLVAPASVSAGWERACGSVVENYRDQGGREEILASKITGHEVRCGAARKVARAYASRSHYSRMNRHGERIVRNRYPRAVGRFRCSDERLGSDVRSILCHDGPASVSFGWYDSSGYH
jgi:hypothetical protein